MSLQSQDIRRLPGFNWVTLAFYMFLYVPLLLLVIFSFNASRSTTLWEGFTLTWYAKALANQDIQRAAVTSLKVATLATAVSTIFATMAAISLRRNPQVKWKGMFNGLFMLPLAIPEIVVAIATLTFFAAIKLSLGLGNLVIAHTVFCIPFAYLPIRARLESMDASLEAAASDLYSDKWATLWLITLPLLAPAIISGAMLAFIVSLDDFIITLMVADAGSTTLPIYIYSLVRVGVTPEVNAISTLLLFVSTLLVLASSLLSKKT